MVVVVQNRVENLLEGAFRLIDPVLHGVKVDVEVLRNLLIRIAFDFVEDESFSISVGDGKQSLLQILLDADGVDVDVSMSLLLMTLQQLRAAFRISEEVQTQAAGFADKPAPNVSYVRSLPAGHIEFEEGILVNILSYGVVAYKQNAETKDVRIVATEQKVKRLFIAISYPLCQGAIRYC